jgi:ketosteroid isomerase-like protein
MRYTSIMNWTICIAITLASFAACKKKEQPEMNATPGTPGAMGSSGDMGSAMTGKDMGGSAALGPGAGSGSGSGSAAAPKPKTAEEIAARYEECLVYFNTGKFEEMKTCLVPDVVVDSPGSGAPEVKGSDAVVADAQQQRAAMSDLHAEPQLVLVSGHDVVGVLFLTGTNDGAMKSPQGEVPATKKKIALYVAQAVTVDDTAHVTRESDYFDVATMTAQLGQSKKPARAVADKGWGPKVLAIAKDDDKEKANLAVFNALADAFNKHDAKAVLDTLSDDTVWSEQAQPKDWDKKTVGQNLPLLWKRFADLKFDVKKTWAAGDYVAAVQSFEGTSAGKHVSLPLLSLHKIDAGKIKQSWIFAQSMGMDAQLK